VVSDFVLKNGGRINMNPPKTDSRYAARTKDRDRFYPSGRSKHWIEVKNRKHPAFAGCWKRIASSPAPRLRF